MPRKMMKLLCSIALIHCLIPGQLWASDINEDDLSTLIYLDDPKTGHENIRGILDELKPMGPDVVPPLARMHGQSNVAQRALIARIFNGLGWMSTEAEQALLQDIRTENRSLRIQTQYALGRVSDSTDVVDALLENMQKDNDAYFRDKAACALAYDQVHLDDVQKAHLFDGLIASLSSPNAQVRNISMKALKIQTGQTKGFKSNAPFAQRQRSIKEWEAWLAEYRNNL